MVAKLKLLGIKLRITYICQLIMKMKFSLCNLQEFYSLKYSRWMVIPLIKFVFEHLPTGLVILNIFINISSYNLRII